MTYVYLYQTSVPAGTRGNFPVEFTQVDTLVFLLTRSIIRTERCPEQQVKPKKECNNADKVRVMDHIIE